MLSKNDIQKELGKGICIYPLNLANIKENSINLCAGEFAWATVSRDIYFCEDEYDKNKRFSLDKNNTYDQTVKISAGNSAIIEDAQKNKYIILLPLSTTLIETNEVLSVSSYIGGTYHSKVGLVAKGLGHIGTMVGPNFSGDSLIAIHNTSQKLVVLQVGDSFVSVVFHYLNTPYHYSNPTLSGHIDKFSELGLHISEAQAEVLNADWKKQFHEVCQKMRASEEYQKLQTILTHQKKNWFQKYVNKKNIFICLAIVAILVGLLVIAFLADAITDQKVWVDRYFNVGLSGAIIAIISALLKHIKPNSEE